MFHVFLMLVCVIFFLIFIYLLFFLNHAIGYLLDFQIFCVGKPM